MDLNYAAVYHVKILLINSHFYKMDRTALYIESKCSLAIKKIVLIKNCTFGLITANPAIYIVAPPINQSISFVNCKFYRNERNLIEITVSFPPNNNVGCNIVKMNDTFPMTAIHIGFIRCQFSYNRQKLLTLESKLLSLEYVYVFFKSLNILHNSYGLLKDAV